MNFFFRTLMAKKPKKPPNAMIDALARPWHPGAVPWHPWHRAKAPQAPCHGIFASFHGMPRRLGTLGFVPWCPGVVPWRAMTCPVPCHGTNP